MDTLGGFQTNAGTPDLTNAGAPVDGVDEVQRLTSTATGGAAAGITFVNPLTGVSKKTGAIPWNAALAAIQAAFDALTNMPAGGVVVSGGPTIDAAPVDLTFAGSLSGLNIAQVVVDNTGATGGTIVPSTVTAGVQGTARGAAKGELLKDTTTPKLYQNAGTPQKPVWQKVGPQA